MGSQYFFVLTETLAIVSLVNAGIDLTTNARERCMLRQFLFHINHLIYRAFLVLDGFDILLSWRFHTKNMARSFLKAFHREKILLSCNNSSWLDHPMEHLPFTNWWRKRVYLISLKRRHTILLIWHTVI